VDFEMMLAEYGYTALFFVFCLGIIGLPIPNEVIVMTGGATTAEGLLHPLPSFLLTYLGVCCGLTVGFAVGRFIGLPILERVGRGPKIVPYIVKSQQLAEKYGSAVLLVTYFIPVVRNVIPYVMGAAAMRFTVFAIYAYSGALVWTMLFFMIGRVTGAEWLIGLVVGA
jgi:membrane-associated protein